MLGVTDAHFKKVPYVVLKRRTNAERFRSERLYEQLVHSETPAWANDKCNLKLRGSTVEQVIRSHWFLLGKFIES